jgi:hypothetical protein
MPLYEVREADLAVGEINVYIVYRHYYISDGIEIIGVDS